MRRLVPRLSLAGWSVWLLLSLGLALAYPSRHTTLLTVISSGIDFGIKGGGIVLSVMLCQRANRGLAFLLAGLCLFTFLRFYLGDILFHMLPQLGGLTFAGAVADWWQRNTSSVLRAIVVMPFGVFLAGSLVTWPWYALIFDGRADETKG